MVTTASAMPAEGDSLRRPDHVNNALSPHFPAVFNQDGGSCGSASRIGYMFTHEINAYRGADASKPENIYPTHFTWLLTNSHSGKEGMARANGVPSSVVYGGKTYSADFGNQDCSAQDFGWMQGYEKWYAAMCNRIERNSFSPDGVDTEAGRERVKNWIWNHCGDTDFTVGGIVGIGVASACKQGSIPDDSLGVNKNAGVVGMKYVTRWGDGVDHALTIVGYDDRILFDLDGNGICGEKDKDERGAWIIVNSWGNGWANKGFIYCPYKYGYPVRQNEGGAWKPEFYHVRKNYRPLRTLKLTMSYSRRSELKLSVGVAADINAERPDTVIAMEHFKFAGDGRGKREKRGLEAATPMLGRWADGQLHEEPMEFGYDLTDLSSLFDTRRPLKYFFIVESQKDAIGHGRIRNASVIDYEFDTKGVETPLTPPRGVAVANGGDTTIVAAVVQGEPLFAPTSVSLSPEGQLAWEAPQRTHYRRCGYVIFNGNTPADTLSDNRTSWRVPAQSDARWGVAAGYAAGDSMLLSYVAHADDSLLYMTGTPNGNTANAADFTPSAATVAAGERISFLPEHPLPGARYEWRMKGADREIASTTNAAATYDAAGKYRVKLSVFDTDGRRVDSRTMRLNVEERAPKADFAVSPQYLLAGEALTLTDRSSFAPETLQWFVESRRYALRAKGKEAKLKMNLPGRYDVTLTAANKAGEDRITRRGSIVVCAADSRNGLNFSRKEAAVETDGDVFGNATEELTVAWWMNAAQSADVAGMGDEAATWRIKGNADGNLTFTADSINATAGKGFIQFGNWHHYAVTFNRGTVTFFRNGERIAEEKLNNKKRTVTQLPHVKTWRLGGKSHPMNAVVDEVRIWRKALTAENLQKSINLPLADVATAERDEALALYYDFNQNGGDVQDRCSGAHHGRRIDFGPDGDAWGLSRGVFSLNFTTPMTDLSEQLLPPSRAPFEAGTGTVNTRDAKRFLTYTPTSERGGWTVENAIGNDTLRTGIHVDRNKDYALTVTTGWDGFSASLNNHKLYTTVTLPAGRYELEVVPHSGMHTGGSRLVAAPGRGLPDFAGITQQAIASAPLAERSLSFVVDRETELSLGIVFMLTGNTCVPIREIKLYRTAVEGED